MTIADAAARVDLALSAWRTDPQPRNAPHHLEAAMRATGDLQRALILCRLSYDNPQPRKEDTMAKKSKPAAKPPKKPCKMKGC